MFFNIEIVVSDPSNLCKLHGIFFTHSYRRKFSSLFFVYTHAYSCPGSWYMIAAKVPGPSDPYLEQQKKTTNKIHTYFVASTRNICFFNSFTPINRMITRNKESAIRVLEF